jgi:hypothetical protein
MPATWPERNHSAGPFLPAKMDLFLAAINNYRFIRRYLERHPQLPLSLRQVDPLIRQLTLYRDLIQDKTKESTE